MEIPIVGNDGETFDKHCCSYMLMINYFLGLTWSCSVTSNRQLGHHEVSTVVSSLHHPGCCCIQECRGDPEYC